ncbi:hypothetical protein UK15_07770 [Streptomyces variegatus]|uniref:Uncharacterized protein n=1 Tax=Streptomyces variegatus TaxID=284040 RepID=A0A0M2GVS3_9ACTN|nr:MULTISPECIES: hypothetical protein [Streptomyces]KJK40240.1 hypothetical protein UK15_07770 [Streptomyces variegatus]
MADEHDKSIEQLAMDLAVSYAEIATALRHLPIPIRLPEGLVQPKEAVEGMIRALELMDSEPVPEGVRLDFQVACTSWLNTEDLFRLEIVKPRPYRVAGATLCLLTASEAIIQAMEWLVENQE